MIYLDKFANINKIAGVNPAEKIIFALSLLVWSIASDSPVVHGTVIVTMALVLLFYAKIPSWFYAKLLLLPSYFIFATAATIIVSNTTDTESLITLFHFGENKYGVTAENLARGGSIFLRSLSAVSCMYFLALTVPLSDMIHILRKLRFPELLLELLILIYRFIFLMMDTIDRIHTSQMSRLGGRNARSRLRGLALAAASLFVISIKRYENFYNAMESRLYTGKLPRLSRSYAWSPVHMICILLINMFLVYLMTGGKLPG